MVSLLNLLLCSALIASGALACTLQVAAPGITIPDYTPVGTIIVPVVVALPDALEASASNSDTNNIAYPIQFLANNSLLLTGPITVSQVLRVTCIDGSKSSPFIISMIDTDNNAPVWDKWNYTYSVRETQPVPFELPLYPKATDDLDKYSGQMLEYRILPSEYSSYFSLNNPKQSVMNITLVKQLDYEKVQQVVLPLQVLDYNSTGQLVFQVNTTLTVIVINENDENPVWLNSTSCAAGAAIAVCYTRQLLSNSTAGTLIQPPVKAADGNRDLNLPIFYTIVSQAPGSLLSVDNATGALSLLMNLPVPQTYTIILYATQVGDLTKKTTGELLVNIVFASYSPPVFEQSVYNVTVMENNLPGFLVVVVKANDQLRKGVTYGLQNFQSVFTIGASDGQLKTIGSLDYETKSSYILNVSASDGTGIGFVTVILMVGNENEFSPVFTQTVYTFTAVKREKGLVVGMLNATDGDETPVTYSITDADFRKLFAVDPNLGVVTINTEPANLVQQTYRITISASDGSRTTVATVTISFDSALTDVANASVTIIPLIVLGCVFAVIIISVIVAFVLYRRSQAKAKAEAQAAEEEGSEVPGSYGYGDLYELGSTSQQDNPVEGYNNFMFGDEGGPDVGAFYRERDQGELFVSNGYYQPTSANDFSTLTNGSIHTVSGDGSVVGSQRTLVHGSRPRQLHAGSNLQVVQVENAVDAASDMPTGDRDGGRSGPGLTVYF